MLQNEGIDVFESTMIQTDSEKILCVQKIPSKRFFGRWKISVTTLFEILKSQTDSEKHKSFLCMYQKNTTIVPMLKITKSTYQKDLYQLYLHKILQKVHNQTVKKRRINI